MRIVIAVVLFVVTTAGAIAAEATPQATYPPLDDVRDIWSRPWSLEDTPFAITGEVHALWVAEPGYGYDIGEDDIRYRSIIALIITLPDGGRDALYVAYEDDPVGVNTGDTVTVGGVVVGEYEGENRFGGMSSWPIIAADYVTEITDDATPAT